MRAFFIVSGRSQNANVRIKKGVYYNGNFVNVISTPFGCGRLWYLFLECFNLVAELVARGLQLRKFFVVLFDGC